MTTIKPTLRFNCPENWDKMKIGLISRYCDNCKRDVQDFTKLTKEEILQFLWTNKNSKVCGRIFKSQLDYHHEEILVTIDSYIQKNKNSNLSFYLLAIGTMILLGCSTSDNQRKQTIDSLTFASNGQGTNHKENTQGNPSCKIDSLLPDEFDLVGEIMLDDSLVAADTTKPSHIVNGVRIFAEVMPEFNGGFDSLYSYIKKNLKYPEWERKEGIDGNVFVTFIVDEKGKIKEPKILKSVDRSRNFDKEVIKLINEMPNWKPGQENGQDVAVQFTLPIRFRL